MAVLVSLCGCSAEPTASEPDEAETVGSPATPSSSAAVPSTSPRPSPSWRDGYSQAQLDRYDAALSRWQEYTAKTARIYRRGVDTPGARQVFAEYDMQANLRVRSLAETYEAGGVRIEQGPTALDHRASSIGRRVVVIRQCSDYSDVRVTRNGKVVPGAAPEHLRTPLVIEMDRPRGRDWMVARIQLKDATSCSA